MRSARRSRSRMEGNRTGDQSQLEVVLTRLQPIRLPAQALVSYRINRQLSGWSTEDSRRRGALPTPDIADDANSRVPGCLPSLAAHLCSIPIALTAPPSRKTWQ